MITLPLEMPTIRTNPEYAQGFADGFNNAVAELAKMLEDNGVEFCWQQDQEEAA